MADFLLGQIVPALGACISIFLFLSPMKAFMVHSTKYDFNPLAAITMILNCLSWIFYGIFVKDIYIITPNVPGLTLSVWYTVNVYHHGVANNPQRKYYDAILVLGIFLILLVDSAIAPQLLDVAAAQTMAGYMCIIMLLFFYISPLSTLANCVKEKSAVSIHFGLSVASLVNGLLWTVYGIAIQDAFVYGPNFVGCLSASVQLLLKFIYRKSDKALLPLRNIEKDSLDSAEIAS
ncbi:hypothetical protein ROZALSC1DRAFT_31310 [Rozella allomycis CSF55]|uniref:Sugar transporter SWEET1 n=1 Tax=Rozella allomycis (strain CSF55) TaxID=988480 RepID=A0A075AWI5_ROZAC|nr:hypothetical protein O9G_002842 [Rozella allomycis CSF55]RKP16835.1 hypothetical protein ROZALSC1DRAFT_31310 [Rozella allomycis CSF55]|eukprot:EPZ32924.1 hypothetical protein O9G_002842 [Rozella allomycis CSF55]